MKKYIHMLGDMKFVTGMYFMLAIMLGSIGSYFNGLREFSFVTIWQLMGMSIVFGIIHFMQLSKLSVAVKTTIHAILSYATVVIFSLLCNWGFTSANAFWRFTGIFIGIYIVVFLAFAFYYKNEEMYLNRKLDDYKQKNK